MKSKKITLILSILLIVGCISVILTVTYGGYIINSLIGNNTEEKVLAFGDCADVNYIGRYTANNTIFDSSYIDPLNKTGGNPFQIFMSWNESQQPPAGYENYIQGVKGLIEGLVGLKEGDSTTVGPISPADAYGIYPKAGDNFTIYDPESGKEATFYFVNIIPNSTMPEEYVANYGTGKTTLFVLRVDAYALGEKTTFYPSWENATVVTKINETKMWTYTTPPEDPGENFTWISVSVDGYTGIVFPDQSSSITSINDTTIIVTHNPQLGATITEYDNYYGSAYYYTVVNVTNDEINVSYVDENTGESSYYAFDRTLMILRNESTNITYTYPTQGVEEMLSYFKTNYNPNLVFSVNELAGNYLTYEVKIVKIYKTS